MNTLFTRAVLLAFLIVQGQRSFSQGTFVNLDFENPMLPLIPGGDGQVPISDALPGWSGYLGTTPVSRVLYDDISLGGAFISLVDNNSANFPVLQGSFSAWLQESVPGGAVVPAIGQIGTVPSNARSLLFYGGGFTVTFAGQSLPVALLSLGPNYGVFGADISALAGQTGELKFQGVGSLDNILFSPTPIPEPSVIGLLALGVFLIATIRKKRKC